MQKQPLRVDSRAIGAALALAFTTIIGAGVSMAAQANVVPPAPGVVVGPPQAWGFNSSTQNGQFGLTTMQHPGFLYIGETGSYVLGGTYGRTSNPCAYAYGTGGVAGYQGNPRSTTGSSLDGHGSENIVTGQIQVNCQR